jgi:hypothetical protein
MLYWLLVSFRSDGDDDLELRVEGEGNAVPCLAVAGVGLRDVGLTGRIGWGLDLLLHSLVDGKAGAAVAVNAVEGDEEWHAAAVVCVAVEVVGDECVALLDDYGWCCPMSEG